MGLARHEPNIRAAARTELDCDELIALLDPSGPLTGEDWQEAIACCLSGSEGWDEAARRLGGAFAPAETGLRPRKAD
jgi:hypothetical protein